MAGVEERLHKLLSEVVSISQGIRSSAFAYANSQNFHVFERLRRQLETIRISADAILGAIAKASLTNHTMDDRIIDWLISGEPRSCVSRLKEMHDMLQPRSLVRSSLAPAPLIGSGEDKLVTAMAFLDKHKTVFHFLVTSDIWNWEKVPSQSSEMTQTITRLSTPSGTTDKGDQHPRASSSAAPENGYTHDSDAGHPSSSNRMLTPVPEKEPFQRRLDEILQWFAALNFSEKHRQMLRLRQEGTCVWFPNTAAYKKWRTGGNRFMWLQGIAGCGKSVLVASTIEYLKKSLRDEEPLAFFYCDFRNERSTSSTEVMRSLLSQLYRYYRDRGIDPGEHHTNKILEEKKEGTLSHNSLDKLCDLLSRIARSFRYEPIVVIDALDECVDMEELLGAVATLSQGDVRLLVTSRPHPSILRRFTGLPSLSFGDLPKELARDIALHVRRELESHSRLRSAKMEIKDEIRAKLNEKADGRFRWVQCQLDTLRRCETEWELKEVLDDLPTELEVTYERILETIDERKSEGELARRALAWLVVALEPLHMTQVVEGLSVDLQRPNIDSQTGWPVTALTEALSSLVSYYEETDILALSHFSVKEYLTSRTALPKYYVVSHAAHAEVAQMCLHYVSIYLTQEQGCCAVVAPWKSFPLLSYALSFGFNHIAYVIPGSPAVLEALVSLGSVALRYPSHWDYLCQLRENDLRWPQPLWPSSRHDVVLYILIAYSSASLFESFLASRHSLRPRIGTNPLVYAADLRKTSHALALLEYGAEVNVPGLVIDDSYKPSPLEVAIDRGEHVLVGELLQRGCTVTSELLATAICMPWCNAPVLLKLAQTDEFVEWVNDIGDEKLCRGIFNSARPGAGDKDRVALARRLRQVGQDLSPNSLLGSELIDRAVHAAHTSMLEYLLPPGQPPHPRFLLAASTGETSETVPLIRFLLSKGVDINAVSDGKRDTALHLAAMCSWEPRSLELVKMLIEAGCNPRIRNSRGETPLIIAVNRDYVTVVEHLLSSNVPLPSDILPTALFLKSTPRMVDFLIHKGADMHSIASNGDTVLHLAISCYPESHRLIILKVLTEAGCNLSICNSEGKTVLETAVERKHSTIVEFLLSHDIPLPPDILLMALRQRSAPKMVASLVRRGAIVHCTTSDGDTVLHIAIAEYAEVSQLALIRTFLEAGCDPTTCNSDGKTVFEAAIKRGYTSVMGRLLSCGVSAPSDVLRIALRQRSTLKMIQFLIDRGANVNYTTPDEDTLLHLVIANYAEGACCSLVKSFVKAGTNPAAHNSEGKTVLQAAIDREYTSVVELLLSSDVPFPSDILLIVLKQRTIPRIIQVLISQGADVHSTTSDGDTVLHLAISEYAEEACSHLVKDFVEAGCNPTTSNFAGKTALDAAIKHEYFSVIDFLLPLYDHLPPDILLTALQQKFPLSTLRFLIRRGANVHSTMSNGDTVFHLAILQYTQDVCLALFNIFIEAGCDPSTSNSDGETAWEYSVIRGYNSVMDLLLSHNILLPPDILLFALKRCHPETFLHLINKGANIHATTPDGNTVLHSIITRGHAMSTIWGRTLVDTLIDAGCDPNARNSAGESVLEVALKHGPNNTGLIALLLSQNITMPPDILLSALKNHATPEILGYLVSRGAYVDSATSNGDTVLHLAIAYDETESRILIKYFIEAGCDPTSRNDAGDGVLETAVRCGYILVVEFLLSLDVPLPSDILLTATAAWKPGSLKMALFLIRRGADVHCISPGGDTLLHHFCITNCPEISLLMGLIRAGCDPDARNSAGKTVLEVAIERGNVLAVEVLLSQNVTFPPHILLIVLQLHSTLAVAQCFIRRGADVHSTTSDGDTLLHLAIAEYPEAMCWAMVNSFIKAGCSPTARNSAGKRALEAAIEREYTSVVELLLSRAAPFPPNMLLLALQRCSSPEMIQLLVGNHTHLHETLSGSNWDAIVETVDAAYSASNHDRVMSTLEAARGVERPGSDETLTHAAKRRGLE